MQDFADIRLKMVDNQLRTNGVTNHRILDAMTDVPREMFVDPSQRSIAYSDGDIPFSSATAPGRYLQKPMVFAKLVQAAEIDPDDFVLVVGCNSGYALAVVARLASAVVGVEENSGLAARASELMTELEVENADVFEGPLAEGCKAQGPYDVIIFDGAAELVPESIHAQLRDGGRLVHVDGDGRSANAAVVTKSGNTLGKRLVFNAASPLLPGFTPAPAFVFGD